MDRTFRRPFCPNLRFCFARVHNAGIRACADDLVVLFEFLDDDTKLAQSCTDWLYLQHWHTIVPDPAMCVTTWALMGVSKDCEVCHTTRPLTPFCVCSLCLLREVGQGIETLWVALCAFCVAHVCSRGISVDTAFLLFRSPWQDGGRCQPRFDVTHYVGSLCVYCVTHLYSLPPFFGLIPVWHEFSVRHMFWKICPRVVHSLLPLHRMVPTVVFSVFKLLFATRHTVVFLISRPS